MNVQTIIELEATFDILREVIHSGVSNSIMIIVVIVLKASYGNIK